MASHQLAKSVAQELHGRLNDLSRDSLAMAFQGDSRGIEMITSQTGFCAGSSAG